MGSIPKKRLIVKPERGRSGRAACPGGKGSAPRRKSSGEKKRRPDAEIAAYDPKTGAGESAGPQPAAPSANGSTPTIGVPVASVAAKPEPLPVLADEPDLVAAVVRDIASVGVIGEEDNALLIYLAFTSRIQPDPLAVVTRRRTGTGKSTLLEKVARLFPENAIVHFLAFTNASLFNSAEDCFKHKILITGERKHSTDEATHDANAMLRQLLSEKKIDRQVSVPGGKDGRWVTERQVRPGPVAYAESTTAGSIFEEDLNRMLELYTDESRAQNRLVMRSVAAQYAPDRPEEDEEAVIARHRKFQESLRPFLRAVVPYAPRLVAGIPDHDPRCRRVSQQVMSVIEAVTLLHQHQREKTKDGKRLIAEGIDYAVARRLLVGPVHSALGLGGDTFRKCAQLRKALPDKFNSNQALPHFANKMTRDRTLSKLVELDLLERTKAGLSHTPAEWRWVTDRNPDELVLPPLEKVLSNYPET
jgi:hypothetical protein